MKTMYSLFKTGGMRSPLCFLAAVVAALTFPSTLSAKKAYADSQGRLGLAGPPIANPAPGTYTGNCEAQAGNVYNCPGIKAGNKAPGLVDKSQAFAEAGDAAAVSGWSIRVAQGNGKLDVRTGVGAMATNTETPAWGRAAVLDPWSFDDVAGDALDLVFGFDGVSLGAEGWESFGNLTGFAGTNLPGLETLFNYSIVADGSQPEVLHLTFWSNPLLGIDDSAVIDLLAAAILFDPATGGFSADPAGFDFLSFQLQVPLDQPNLVLNWNLGAQASVVPEPSTLAAGLAAAGLALIQILRRRKKAGL
ncbi:hypothetical protein DB347_24585 [Opitutaceae bacterium EW11]|nr:hypothetical protein DB347_24585 [Opitutaceae bacterium EW11]